MQTVILPPPRNREHVVDYARAVKSCLDDSGVSQFTHLSIRLPIYLPPAASIAASNSLRLSNGSLPSPLSTNSFTSSNHAASPLSETELNATWEMWDTIRSLCDYNPRLSLSKSRLMINIISQGSEKSFVYSSRLDCTTSEQYTQPFALVRRAYPLDLLACVVICPQFKRLPGSRQICPGIHKRYGPSEPCISAFLAKCVKALISFAQHRPTIILENTQAGLHSNGGSNAYPQYVRHLEKTSDFNRALETPGSVTVFAQGYQDYLQAPLQVRSSFTALRECSREISRVAVDGQFAINYVRNV